MKVHIVQGDPRDDRGALWLATGERDKAERVVVRATLQDNPLSEGGVARQLRADLKRMPLREWVEKYSTTAWVYGPTLTSVEVPLHADSWPQAKRLMWAAYAEVERHLRARFIAAITQIGERQRKRTVVGVSAMGTWFIHLDHPKNELDSIDIYHPVCRSFSNALEQWGWNAIPAPILVRKELGKPVEVLTNW